MNKVVTIIGCGNIGSALAIGLGQNATPLSLMDSNREQVLELANELGVRGSTNLREAVKNSEIIILAVKPKIILSVLAELNKLELKNTIIVSTAAGVSLSELKDSCDSSAKLVRVMPNLAMEYGAGVTGVYSEDLSAAVRIKELFSLVGVSTVLKDEKQIAAVTGVSGSGPAFVCAFIKGLEEAGVQLGLVREDARLIAAQTALGASKLVLDGEESPESIMKRVATPGGTTENGLNHLAEKDFEKIVIEAVKAAYKRALETMGQA